MRKILNPDFKSDAARRRLQRLAQLVGAALIAVSIGYIGVVLWSERRAFESFRPDVLDLALLAGGATAYGASSLLLAGAWDHLLRWAGEPAVRRRDSYHLYARTQLAKYIPGNVAQLAGRQVLGRAFGWSHFGLALSTLFELVSLLGVGALVTLAGLGLFGMEARDSAVPAVLLIVGLAAFAAICLPLGRRVLARTQPELAERLSHRRLADLWPASLRHLGFFLIGGGLLALTVHVVVPGALSWALAPGIAALFGASWLAGMITPGAPSGLGVREAVLVFGLASVAPAGPALLIAGLLRLVTVGGDVLFYLVFGRSHARAPRTGEDHG